MWKNKKFVGKYFFKLNFVEFIEFFSKSAHRDDGPLTGRTASHRKAILSKEAGPLTKKFGLSKGGRVSHREAGTLTGRHGL